MGSKYSNIQYGTFNQSDLRVTVIAKDKETGQAEIYSMGVSDIDEGTNFPKYYHKSGARALQPQYNTNGSYSATTLGDETMEEMTATITFADDYNYISVNPKLETVCRSVLDGLLSSSFFYDGANLKKVISNAGLIKINNKSTQETNGEQKYLFLRDGRFIIQGEEDANTGEPATEANTTIDAVNESINVIMIEQLTMLPNGKKRGLRYVYVATSKTGLTENKDYNKISKDLTFHSDAREINEFWVEKQTRTDNAIAITTPASSISLYNLNTIINISVSGGGTPTVSSTEIPSLAVNDLAGVIDSDNGKLSIYKCTDVATPTWVEIDTTNLVLGEGLVLSSYYYDTALDGATKVNQANKVAVKTAGASSVAVVAKTVFTEGYVETPATETYLYKVNNWSNSEAQFKVFTGSNLYS